MEKIENNKKWFIIKSFFNPLWIITDNLRNFFMQGVIFSLILTIFSYVFGQKFLCVFNKQMAENMFCPNLSYLYFLYLFFKIILICVFINIWYNTTFNKVVFNKEYLKNIWKKVLKTFLFLVLFIVLNSIPFISTLILFFRVPNPNWLIELLFFIFVSIGFWVPFVLMRFYGLFANFLNNENWKNFKEIWIKTTGYAGKIIFSVALIFMVILVLLVVIMSTFIRTSDITPELYNFIAEMFLGFANYFMIILLVNFCQNQKQIFLDK